MTSLHSIRNTKLFMDISLLADYGHQDVDPDTKEV